MLIGGLQKFTVLDYPDHLAATIFTVGCNLRCPYCHNAEIIDIKNYDPQQAIPPHYIFQFLKDRVQQLDGVCITGGEPTLQQDLPQFIQDIKQLGFSVKLDTNGTNFHVIQNILDKQLVDYIAIDIKTDFQTYNKVGGNAIIVQNILNTIDLISKSNVSLELRTTMAPEIVDEQDIDRIINMLNQKNPQILANLRRYTIQNFRPHKTLNKHWETVVPYEENILTNAVIKLQQYCPRVDVLM